MAGVLLEGQSPYTQLFLTHIDEDGETTPPVVLEHFTAADRAANIPEFIPLPADAIAKIKEQFIDAYSFLRAGMANERTGNYPAAVRAYERGLAVEPGNVELLNALGFSLFQQGKSKDAVVALEKAIAIDPKHWKSHNNLALASIDLGELEVAEAHYRESLALKEQPAIYNDLGFVLERQGLLDEAAAAYRKAIKLDPGSASAHYNLGRLPGARAASSPRPRAISAPPSRRTPRMQRRVRPWPRCSRSLDAGTRRLRCVDASRRIAGMALIPRHVAARSS